MEETKDVLKDDYERRFVRNTIGGLVKEAREKRGWTIYELSKRTGYGKTHLLKIEEGAYAIRVDVLHRLCKVLCLHIDFPLIGEK